MTPDPPQHAVEALQHATSALTAVHDALGAVQDGLAETADAHLAAMKSAIAGIKSGLVRKQNSSAKFQGKLTGLLAAGLGGTTQSAISAVGNQQNTLAQAAVGMRPPPGAPATPTEGFVPPRLPAPTPPTVPAGGGPSPFGPPPPPPPPPPPTAGQYQTYYVCNPAPSVMIQPWSPAMDTAMTNSGWTATGPTPWASQALAQEWITQNWPAFAAANCPGGAPGGGGGPAGGGGAVGNCGVGGTGCREFRYPGESYGFSHGCSYTLWTVSPGYLGQFAALDGCHYANYWLRSDLSCDPATDGVNGVQHAVNTGLSFTATADGTGPGNLSPVAADLATMKSLEDQYLAAHPLCPGSPPPPPPPPPTGGRELLPPALNDEISHGTFCSCPVIVPPVLSPPSPADYTAGFEKLAEWVAQLGASILRAATVGGASNDPQQGGGVWIDACVWDPLARLIVRHFDQDDGPTADMIRLMSNAGPCLLASAYDDAVDKYLPTMVSAKARAAMAVRNVLASLLATSVGWTSGGVANYHVGAGLDVGGAAPPAAAPPVPPQSPQVSVNYNTVVMSGQHGLALLENRGPKMIR